MSRHGRGSIHTYAQALGHFTTGEKSRNLYSRKIQRNTYVERDNAAVGCEIYIRLHNTRIVTYRADGTVSVHMRGWDTVTTKDRVNGWSPLQVWSEGRKGLFVSLKISSTHDPERYDEQGERKRYAYDDYVTLYPNGTLKDGIGPNAQVLVAEPARVHHRSPIRPAVLTEFLQGRAAQAHEVRYRSNPDTANGYPRIELPESEWSVKVQDEKSITALAAECFVCELRSVSTWQYKASYPVVRAAIGMDEAIAMIPDATEHKPCKVAVRKYVLKSATEKLIQ